MTVHIYVIIIMTYGFSKKSLLFFPRNSLEQSWPCDLGIYKHFIKCINLQTIYKHFYKTHRTILFSFYLLIFYLLFQNLCINTLHIFVLFHCVQTHWMSLFVVLQSLCILTLAPFVIFASQAVLKRKPKSFNMTSSCEIW